MSEEYEGITFREEKYLSDPDKFVQLIPTMPILSGHKVVIQKGTHSAEWIRIIETISTDLLLKYAVECESKQQGAVYIAIPQRILSDEAKYLSIILQRGYKFYIHHPETDELIWYKWTKLNVEDRVPNYATSIEGGGALIISPDNSKVLLVFEFGCWSRVGGSVDRGESCLNTAIRECVEETGIKLDDNFEPLYAMSYNQAKSRDGAINDHFCMFILKAADETLQIDETEIEKANWFYIDELVREWKIFKDKHKGEVINYIVELENISNFQGNVKLSALVLIGLERYFYNLCHPVTYVKFRSKELRHIF